MAQPPRYERKKNFTLNLGWETDHVALNAELDGAAKSINGIRANLALIQRDDGKLAQGIVTADSVDAGFADELSGKVSSGVQGALDDAKASALSATLAANTAENSRNSAAGSATSAATSASAAASSASSAALSLGNSTTKANEAAASAASAAASKDAAAASAAGAASSATNAAVAATNADLAKNNAATSASNAATSATNSANSASNSEASAAASASAYDDFDRRFLGAKAADPTTDNDGQPLQTGAMYWRTTSNEMRVWTGTAWQTPTLGIPVDGSVSKQKFNQSDVTPFAQSVLDDTSADIAKRTLGVEPGIFPIAASVSGNAMTLTLNPCVIDFRAPAQQSGAINTRIVSAPVATVISAGSTAGTTSGVLSRIYLVALDNNGTVELGWINSTGANAMNESGLATTMAEGGAGGADIAANLYATAVRSNLPYRMVGYVEFTQAVAGQWAAAPSKVVGGSAATLAELKGIGVGQTWQNLSGNRAANTTYTNTSGMPIQLSIAAFVSAANGGMILTINGAQVAFSSQSASGAVTALSGAIVPNGASYSLAPNTGTLSGLTWLELR